MLARLESGLLLFVTDDANRRRFQRVQAPVYCRPLGKPFFGPKSQPIDISTGGLRIYGDDPMSPGDRLELELFLPDETSVVCEAEVVWVDPLPADAPARFDVGLKFLHVGQADLEKLAAVLEKSPIASA